jgi:hypothetical protein
LNGPAQVIRVVVDPAADKDMPYQVQLDNDLFEPEFIDLMDDDKKHFIVACFKRFKTFGMLTVQDFIQLDIVGIIKVFHRALLSR